MRLTHPPRRAAGQVGPADEQGADLLVGPADELAGRAQSRGDLDGRLNELGRPLPGLGKDD